MFPSHDRGEGKLYMNFTHYYTYKWWIHQNRKDEDIELCAKVFHRLISYPWKRNIYLNMEFNSFLDVMATKTEEEKLHESWDMNNLEQGDLRAPPSSPQWISRDRTPPLTTNQEVVDNLIVKPPKPKINITSTPNEGHDVTGHHEWPNLDLTCVRS